ncbi:MAG: hypothetical protein AABZ74_13725 [Cyanobacteriota bacterium]
MSDLRKELKKIQNESENRLEQWLITNILDSEDSEAYLQDIINCGCQNGVISELIYYKDVYPFFDEYYLEIQELLLEYQDEVGTIELQSDIKSKLTWLAVEIIAYRLANQLDVS